MNPSLLLSLVLAASSVAFAADQALPANTTLTPKAGTSLVRRPGYQGSEVGVFSGLSSTNPKASGVISFQFVAYQGTNKIGTQIGTNVLRLDLPLDGTNVVAPFNPWPSDWVRGVTGYECVQVVNSNRVPVIIHGLGGEWIKRSH